MAELKKLTVQALRDLARKALGRGHSKLRTKAELIAALQSAERKVAGVAGKAAGQVREATGRAVRATERAVASVRGAGRALSGAAKAAREAANAKAKAKPRSKAKAVRGAVRPAKDGGHGRRGATAEPDPEGHMVARVAGEEAARGAPHPLTESALDAARVALPATQARARVPAELAEGLGDLPRSYEDDALMALPRDPKTLFLYWDHGPDTLRQAWDGLDGGKPQLWVFAQEPGGGWARVRQLDFALESRSYYVHGLEPGRVYRAEIHVVDRQGRDRLLPRASNPMMLPAAGPSPIIDDRFMRLLWGDPLQRLLQKAHAAGAFPEDVRAELARLSDWSRFQGQSGGSSAGGLGAGGMGGRPSSPWMRPSSPSSPSSPWGRSGGEDP